MKNVTRPNGEPLLNQLVSRVRILAQRENTALLVAALESEGLRTSVIRPKYMAEQEAWARNTKCLWGHRTIWQAIVDSGETMCMVCEADFVPCIGLGSLPLPFQVDDAGDALGYLYAGGPEIFSTCTGAVMRAGMHPAPWRTCSEPGSPSA